MLSATVRAALIAATLAVAATAPATVAGQEEPAFRRGDANADGRIDIRDALELVGVLFVGEPTDLDCRDSGDANDDGRLDISDPAAVLSSLFLGRPNLDGTCAADATADVLTCAVYARCPTDTTAVFRVVQLALRDPHILVPLDILGCRDVTDDAPLNLLGINDQVAIDLLEDADGDGILDLNLLLILAPLAPAPGGSGELRFAVGRCTAPFFDSVCSWDSTSGPARYSINSATCLGPDAETLTEEYSPEVNAPSPPCVVSQPVDWELLIVGTRIPLHSVRTAATLSAGSPDALAGGLLIGFLTQEDADSAQLDPTLPFVGGEPLSSVLPGGRGNCATHDDRDRGPNGRGGTTRGWWFYFNFRAERVAAALP